MCINEESTQTIMKMWENSVIWCYTRCCYIGVILDKEGESENANDNRIIKAEIIFNLLRKIWTHTYSSEMKLYFQPKC